MSMEILEMKERINDIEKLIENEENERSLVLLGVEHLEGCDDLIWEVQRIFTSVHAEIPDSCIASAVWNPKPSTFKSIIVKFIGKRWKDRATDSKTELEKRKYSVADYPLPEDTSHLKIIFWNCPEFENMSLGTGIQILSLYTTKFETAYDINAEFGRRLVLMSHNEPGNWLAEPIKDVPPNPFIDLNGVENVMFSYVRIIKRNIELIIGNVYIRRHKFKEDLERLDCLLSEQTKKYPNNPIIIGGDFGCWVGEIQEELEDLANWRVQNRRYSLHQKPNEEGEKLLEVLNKHEMIILNGRCRSDSPGKITHRKLGKCAVSDYIAIARKYVNAIEDFAILFPIEKFSVAFEHHPVVVTLRHLEL